MEKKSILFVYRNFSTFVRKDYDILKKKYKVIPLHATKNLFKLMLKLVWKIRKVDLVFIWFAGWHAFLAVLFAKIFRKKSVVVAGGYDAAYVPEINYGVFCSWWRGRLAKFVYKNADLVLAVSNYTKNEILKHASPKRIEMIYHGFNWKKIKPVGKKENIVLSVGTAKVKRADVFIESAKYLPSVDFILVGDMQKIKSPLPSNVKILKKMAFKKLLKLYQRAKVYVQISASEGFGCSLAEAMLCECIPVVTRRGAIPEVVGDCGFYVPYNDAKATAKAIKKALNSKDNLGKKARERVVKLFPLEKRTEELLKSIEMIMNE